MSVTEILLNSSTTDIERVVAADAIIKDYDVILSQEQILAAHKKIRDYDHYGYDTLYSNILLMNNLLELNINMYTALILALNNEYKVYDMIYLFTFSTSGIIIKHCYYPSADYDLCTRRYKTLLNYYDFDVSNLIMNEDIKAMIQEYRNKKYGALSVKCAIKK